MSHIHDFTHIIVRDATENNLEMKPELKEHLPEDSVVISTLLHGVCKADIYKEAIKNAKMLLEDGKSIKVMTLITIIFLSVTVKNQL